MNEQEYQWLYVPGHDECENLEGYRIGGYHPVEIGDQLCDGKYTVVHKLSAGTAATVWLAQTKDGDGNIYVAVKILAANHSNEDCNELRVQKHLLKAAQAGHKLSSVALLLDQFWIDGPNGRHLCLTYEAAGPSLSMVRRNEIKLSPEAARSIALQMAQGLQELHDAGAVYGDLSTNNLLLRLVDINTWTVDQLYEKLGHPEHIEIQTADGQALDSHAPRFEYLGIRFCERGLEYLKPEIAFVDLADGCLMNEIPRESASGWSVAYTAPETLWFKEMQDRAADIWALACIWFEMRAAAQMLEEGYGSPEETQQQILELIGPLPASWLKKLPPQEPPAQDDDPDEANGGYIKTTTHSDESEDSKTLYIFPFKSRMRKAWLWIMALFRESETTSDPESDPSRGEPSPQSEIPEYFRPRTYVKPDGSLHGKIEHIGKWEEWHYLPLEERLRRKKEWSEDEFGHMTLADVDDEPPPGPLPDEEKADFANLLSSMLKFEKTERAPLKEIVKHPWFKAQYEEASTDEWIKQYTQGWCATMY